LRHAVAIVQAGSFSAAAREINISQSALTRSVQMLEAFYAIKIFARGKSGVRLTMEGARFINIAEESLRRVQMMHEELARVALDHPSTIAFGMGPMTAETLLPILVPKLETDQIRYRIKIQANSALMLMLRHGEIDFFLGGLRKGAEFHAVANQFSVRPIARTSMNLMVREGHPLLSQALTPDNIRFFPTAAGSFVRETFGFSTLHRFGLQEPTMEVDDYGLLLSLASDSDYILICNKMLLKTQPNWRLVMLPLVLDIEQQSEWAIVSPGQTEMAGPVQRTIALLKSIVKDLVESKPESGSKLND
jgi:DNA-binding transcriptional LysR family regulator